MGFEPDEVGGAIPGFDPFAHGRPAVFTAAYAVTFGPRFAGHLLEPFVGKLVAKVHVSGPGLGVLQAAVEEVFGEVGSYLPEDQAALFEPATPVDIDFLRAVFDVFFAAAGALYGKNAAPAVLFGKGVDGLCVVAAGVDGAGVNAQRLAAGMRKFGVEEDFFKVVPDFVFAGAAVEDFVGNGPGFHAAAVAAHGDFEPVVLCIDCGQQ